MAWYVAYRRPDASVVMLVRKDRDCAIEAACALLRDGEDVTGVGAMLANEEIGPAEIRRICNGPPDPEPS